jgi:DhnA family fructose-bisphosphate aldolase class Ia
VEAVKTAVVNKRAGGTGLISGRKAFQRPMDEGIELLNAIQDVYLDTTPRAPTRSRHRLRNRGLASRAIST